MTRHTTKPRARIVRAVEDCTRATLLIGAGFSKWSCDLPLVSGLFDFKIHPDNSTEEKRLVRLQKVDGHWRHSNPDGHNEAFVRASQGPRGRFNLTDWYITRRLSEPFVVQSGRRYTWYINSHYPQHHRGIHKARSFIDAMKSHEGFHRIGIVTTNYDLIPEYALGTRGFNYGKPGEQIGFTPYPYPRPVFATGNVQIAKLHGSISWNHHSKYPDCRCGLTGKCLIVPPITEKQAPPLLKHQWSLARTLLSNCKRLVVFGFSFNEYDTAIRNFIKTQLSPNAEVILIDLVDHRTRLASIFGGRQVHYLNAEEANLESVLHSTLGPY
jgi:hypothetical protein